MKERILMIRLMEKAEKQPAYAKALGIEATGAQPIRKNHGNRKGFITT